MRYRWLSWFSLLLLCAACEESKDGLPSEIGAAPENGAAREAEIAREDEQAAPSGTRTDAEERARRERIDREFPKHGLVTGVQLVVRDDPNPEGAVLGWLRVGARIRLRAESERSPTCNTGWYGVFPKGWVCAGEGVKVGDEPPTAKMEVPPPDKQAALPYAYYYVKETVVPEWHRLPSRNEQRKAQAFIDHYLELFGRNEKLAERFRRGETAGGPPGTAIVSRYLDRGFYVATTGVEIRAFRRFARTVRGSYIKEARLEPRTGGDFRGVELGEDRTLPIAFATRAARPLFKRDRADGTIDFREDDEAEVIERHTIIEGWKKSENIGGKVMHVLEGDRYLRSWFAAVASSIAPPEGVADDEPWVHVDLSEQTLVLYRGKEPLYATLVSTGLDEHKTPVGLFEIRRKLISDTMADLGPDAGDDRYRIEDVPWTQYFAGSVALHGAFWHSGFGLQRSHGCVNISPYDAHRVFNETWPAVPEGWHGVSTDQTGFRGSKVLVTE